MATMNISLPDAMKTWVEEQVATGRYANASDYVRDAVRRDQARIEAREHLQKMVDGAVASGPGSSSREELIEKVMSKTDAAMRSRRRA